jgi:hypothetical protein
MMAARRQFEVPRPPPGGAPLVDPDEAIAIGIMGMSTEPANPNGRLVKAILKALALAGWEIVPKRK